LVPWRVVRKRQEYQEEEAARSVEGTEGRTAAAAANPWGIVLVRLFVEEQESLCCTFLHTGIEV
jgi:hypothetical protein